MNKIQLTTKQQLLSEKLNNADSYVKQLVAKAVGSSNFKRDTYYQEVDNYLSDFCANPAKQNQWIIMGGLRGTGKTTLLCQLYLEWSTKIKEPVKIFFLSLDDAYGLSADFNDIEKVIEAELGEKLHSYKYPIYIFLDEVHFVEKWSVNTKIWHDRCQQLFLLCTGSSAVSFWTNADIARRAKIINIKPLSLSEFVSMKIINQPAYKQVAEVRYDPFNPNPQAKNNAIRIESAVRDTTKDTSILANEISDSLRQCFKHSQSAAANLGIMLMQSTKLANYKNLIKKVDLSEGIQFDLIVRQYISHYMSLPYAISAIQHQKSKEVGINEENIRTSITQTLENIFNKDLNILHSFNQATRAIFPGLLLALANNDTTDLSTLSKKLKVNIQTLQNMLKVLIDGQVISAIPPLGASTGKISKPYKYLFNSPAIRQVLSPIIIQDDGSNQSSSSFLKGKLLEDTIYASFKRIFTNSLTDPQVEYDASSGGADFIIMPRSGIKQEAIVIEVGYNKTSHQQVEKTLMRAGNWGMVITNNIEQPRLVEDKPIIYMPLSLFLIM